MPQFQVGNKGYAYINVTNGSITTLNSPGGDFLLNKGSASMGGSLSVYGGTVSIIGHNLVVGNNGATGSSGNLYQAGGVVGVGSSLEVPGGTTIYPGTVTLAGGTLSVTNNVVLLDSSGAGSGTINLNGGTLTAASVVMGSGQGLGVFNFNGGTLAPTGNSGAFLVNSNDLSFNVLAGGAIINNNGHNITIAAPLLNGTGGSLDGGLLSQGAGTLTLAANNTYTGSTTVGAGTLTVGTTNLAGGTILPGNAVLNITNGTLSVTLTTNGTSLICSNLMFVNGGGTNAVTFNCGTNSDPATPLIYATNQLTVNGTVTVNVDGRV